MPIPGPHAVARGVRLDGPHPRPHRRRPHGAQLLPAMVAGQILIFFSFLLYSHFLLFSSSLSNHLFRFIALVEYEVHRASAQSL